MVGNWLDGLGDWNPQLFREIKGRWKGRNLAIVSIAAILPQLLLLLYHWNRLPSIDLLEKTSRYCTGQGKEYSNPTCLMDSAGNFLINWQLWWFDNFSTLSHTGIFLVLVLGVYLIINDLEKEERLGTLNFLRLTPQSTNSILTGKLFGVPILLAWGALLWLPLHLGAGLSAQIPLLHLASFYGVTIVATLFYYDAALLYGLTTRWLGGFQPWLGSGSLLVALLFFGLRRSSSTVFNVTSLLSPINLLAYVTPNALHDHQKILDTRIDYLLDVLTDLSWYGLPIGANGTFFAIAMSVTLVVCLWWVGRVLVRIFRNPTSTLLSKRHSYALVFCVEAVLLGFCNFSDQARHPYYQFSEFMLVNLIFFLVLIAALTPHRQVLQDWARYRHTFTVNPQATARPKSLIYELLWSEKSPAVLAIAINSAIATTLILGVTLWQQSFHLWPEIIPEVVLSFAMILIYTVLAQLLLLMKTSKRGLWAAGTIASLVVLPAIVLTVLSMGPAFNGELWLFTAFPWVALKESVRWAVWLAALSQTLMFALGSIQLARQLRSAGESAFKQLAAKQMALSSR